jgi:hypothetical protein
MLLKAGSPGQAVAQYRKALVESPPSAVVTQAAPFIRQAFSAAGQPLPAGVPAG